MAPSQRSTKVTVRSTSSQCISFCAAIVCTRRSTRSIASAPAASARAADEGLASDSAALASIVWPEVTSVISPSKLFASEVVDPYTNVSSKLRISGKYAGQNANVKPVTGSIPGFNDRITQFPALIVPSMTVVYTFSPTFIFEGTLGYTRGNQLGSEPINEAANPANDAQFLRPATGKPVPFGAQPE